MGPFSPFRTLSVAGPWLGIIAKELRCLVHGRSALRPSADDIQGVADLHSGPGEGRNGAPRKRFRQDGDGPRFRGPDRNVIQTVAGDLPKLSDVPTGRLVLLFLTPMTVLDDSSQAYTVNQVYAVDSSDAVTRDSVTSPDGRYKISLTEFTRLVK